MNVFKPYNNIDIYFTFQNNQIVLINQQSQILAQLNIDFLLYPGYSDAQYNIGSKIAIQNHLYHVVMCAGRIYVQLLDKVLMLDDSTLKYVATIPDLDTDTEQSFYASLFPMNDYLYAMNHHHHLYVFIDGNFQYVKTTNGYPYSFCHNVYIKVNNYFQQLNLKLETKIIQNPGEEMQRNIPSRSYKFFFNTGAIVLQSYEQYCVVIDMMKKQCKIVEFEPLKHMQSVELRPCGLVNTELLEAVFGKQYIQQVDAEHEKFMAGQLKYQVFSQEVNKVLEKCMDQLPEEYRIQVQMQIASTRRCHVHQPEILHNNLLMNVLKLNQFFDVYASICNDHIYLFNYRKEILRKIPVDFHLYPGSTYKNYCYGKECVFYPQLHNVVYCGSHIYLQYYEKVLELTEDLTLKFIATIPNLTINSAEAFYGRLFSMNGKLYAHNYNGSKSYSGMLHVLENSTFKEVKEMPGYFFQFNDNVYVWDYKTQSVGKLSNSLKLKQITEQMVVQYISWSKGVLILQNQNGSSFFMLNMLTGQQFDNMQDNGLNTQLIFEQTKNQIVTKSTYDSKDFDRTQIAFSSELGQCGLQLQKLIIDDIFGYQSAENINSARIQQQFVNKLLFINQCFKTAQFRNSDLFQSIYKTIKEDMNTQRIKIQRMVQLNDAIVNRFLSVNNFEEQQ
ncbi:Conserved_hypothetical protein [Hexamita inflata]|uniref:Uncharacterized protein n=1 Tax=Hexamita inflata TaxID=28002 RepID=A0AA86R151_9EUKA|nr:Conserved hypothetical protein [Hexamita inflata]